mmetsp:Transcript_10447/g.22955  ORF Transcript_10447/g.22955 Transcript_10447/m.22955 type:complete len:332 (-) Transcript_10447:19-1014(-)
MGFPWCRLVLIFGAAVVAGPVADYSADRVEEDEESIGLQGAADVAKAFGSDARSVGSEIRARISGERALTNEDEADLLAATAQSRGAMMADVAKSLAYQLQQTRDAVDIAHAAVDSATRMEKLTIQRAGKTAADLVDHKLRGVTKDLQDWMLRVVHDPDSEAKTHAASAARPFEKALMHLEERVGQYQQRAEGLMNAAITNNKLAVDVAKGAVEMQEGAYNENYKVQGDNLKAAAKEMVTAHSMMAQASEYGFQAHNLATMAQNLQAGEGMYATAGQMAYLGTMHHWEPKKYPPVPVDINQVFAPPPPPTPLSFNQRAVATRIGGGSLRGH